MRSYQVVVFTFLLLVPAVAQQRYKVGVAERSFVPAGPYDWRGAKTHALLATVWYPAAADANEKPQWIGPPDARLFGTGNAAPGAKPAAGRFPLIVVSHGTGGSALMMSWLGTVLAAHGYIAAAVNHPGNNALEPYTVPGFTLWWERARDLSETIDHLLTDDEFGRRIDPRRIGAAGFSLGGATMIIIAGGIADPRRLLAFCESSPDDKMCQSPPEFPGLVGKFKQLQARDPAFARAVSHAAGSHRDPRVRAVFAIAPAGGPAFDAASLAKVAIPVEIVAGAADPIVPVKGSAEFFAAHIPHAKLVLLGGGVGHYTFLDTCTKLETGQAPLLCKDNPGVDRDAVHLRVAAMAVEFFDEHIVR
jgi:predicted dienelactone hydrolase